MTILGYARTSTTDQLAGLDDQIATLRAHGCDRIWSEQVSSMAARDQLNAALDYAREGDVFVVTKPDRLARSVRTMLDTVEMLRAKGVEVRILSMGVDTSTPTGKLMLTVLSGVAEWEREIMLERQRAGIAKAKAEGKYKGRVRKVDRVQALLLRSEGLTMRQIGDRLGVDPSNVSRAIRGR